MKDGTGDLDRDLVKQFEQFQVNVNDPDSLQRIVCFDPKKPDQLQAVTARKYKTNIELAQEIQLLEQRGMKIGIYEVGALSPHLLGTVRANSPGGGQTYSSPNFSADTAEDIAKENPPAKPSRWHRFLHAVTFGNAYHDEIRKYAKYEAKKAFADAAAASVPARKHPAETELQKEEIRKARQAVNERTEEIQAFKTYEASKKNGLSDWKVIENRTAQIFGSKADPPKDIAASEQIKAVEIKPPKGMSEKDCQTLITNVCMSHSTLDQVVGSGSSAPIMGVTDPVQRNAIAYNHQLTCMMENILPISETRQVNIHMVLPAGRKKAADILTDYANGNPKPAGQMLGAVIRDTMFYLANTPGANSHGFMSAGEMLQRDMDFMEHHPDIKAETGLNQEEFRKLRGFVAVHNCRKEADTLADQLVTNPPAANSPERDKMVRTFLTDTCILESVSQHKAAERDRITEVTPEEFEAGMKQRRMEEPPEDGESEQMWVSENETAVRSKIAIQKNGMNLVKGIAPGESPIQKMLSETPDTCKESMEKTTASLNIYKKMMNMDVYGLRHIIMDGSSVSLSKAGTEVLRENAAAVSQNQKPAMQGNEKQMAAPAPEKQKAAAPILHS